MTESKHNDNSLLIDTLTRCDELRTPNKKLIKATMSTIKSLRDDQTNRPIDYLLNNERILIADELIRNTDPKQQSSILQAGKGLEECQISLDSLTKDPKGYKENTDKAFGEKQRQTGLPLDASRLFLKSHFARLGNYLKTPSMEHPSMAHAEKLLFEERQKNIKAIEKGYIELQQKALGITPASKNKGISR